MIHEPQPFACTMSLEYGQDVTSYAAGRRGERTAGNCLGMIQLRSARVNSEELLIILKIKIPRYVIRLSRASFRRRMFFPDQLNL